MKKSKYKIFLETGKATCSKHGEHSEFQARQSGRYSLIRCRICIRHMESAKYHLDITKRVNYRKKYRLTNPLSVLINKCRERSKLKTLKFDLDVSYLSNLLGYQNNKCALTGVEFSEKNKPSVDRIDCLNGYTKDNIRLVTWKANNIRGNRSDEAFYKSWGRINKAI